MLRPFLYKHSLASMIASATEEEKQDDDPQAAAAAPTVVSTPHVVSPHLFCGAAAPRFCTILWIPPVPGDGRVYVRS